MKSMRHVAATFVMLLFNVGQTNAVELISNGNFEAGTFVGWTVTNQDGGDGSWFIDDADGLTPISILPTLGPADGAFYALTDQGAGTHVLEQSFTVPAPASSVRLSFEMFVNDSDSGPIVDPVGLDYSGPPNQHARVDIMSAGASPFDTGAGVLANFYLGVDPQEFNPNPYTSYLFDITGLVGVGGTFKLRFAEVDNQFYLNQGIDNVSIDFVAIPEPSAVTLLGVGLVFCSWRRRA